MFDFAERVRCAELGKTHLFSVGQAGFIIKSASGKLFGIDMYLSDCVERVEGHVGYKRMLPKILEADELVFDCIVATHFHRDHFDVDSMKALMDNADEQIRCNYLTLGWTPTEGEVNLRKSLGENEAELRKRAAAILPMGRMCDRTDYLDALVYLMSDGSSMMTGSTFRITAGEYI